MIRYVLGCALLLLTGCAPAPVSVVPEEAAPRDLLGACCRAVEVYPKALVALVETRADNKAALATLWRTRAPRLRNGQAVWDYASRYLRPFDIVLTSDKGQIAGELVVGYLTHAMVYIGTESQLRRAGLWDHPDFRPYQARVRAGELFYEARPPKVDFSNVSHAVNVDALSIWRPALTDAQRQDVMARLMRENGKPFDRHMDASTPDCRYCTELILVSFPMLHLIQREAYGRPVVVPDEIAASAIRGQVPLTFVGYVQRAGGAVVSAPLTELAANIGTHWPGRAAADTGLSSP